MLSGYLGGKTLEKKHADKLIEQSKGNPFALGEYLRAWMDQGVLIPGESEWKVDQVRLEKLALPTDVIELLVKRISELSKDSLSTFQQAAIIGYEFSPQLLEKVSGLSPESLKEVIQEGFRVNVIEQTESGYAFIHDKIHEALLSQIQETQKKTIYQKSAEALDSLPDDPPSGEIISSPDIIPEDSRKKS